LTSNNKNGEDSPEEINERKVQNILKASDRDRRSVTSSRLESQNNIWEQFNVLQSVPENRKSQSLHKLGSLLALDFAKTGRYDLIDEIFGNLNKHEIQSLLLHGLMGANSGKGTSHDLKTQRRLIVDHLDPNPSLARKLYHKFGEKRGNEAIEKNVLNSLSDIDRLGLVEGMAASGEIAGLVGTLRNLSDGENRTKMIDGAIKRALRISPEDLVQEIQNLKRGQPIRDELLASMINGLAGIGAKEDARDWISEIEDADLASRLESALGQ